MTLGTLFWCLWGLGFSVFIRWAVSVYGSQLKHYW